MNLRRFEDAPPFSVGGGSERAHCAHLCRRHSVSGVPDVQNRHRPSAFADVRETKWTRVSGRSDQAGAGDRADIRDPEEWAQRPASVFLLKYFPSDSNGGSSEELNRVSAARLMR